MKLPKGVLFDFDGVIVDSFESHYSAWSLAFKEMFGEEIAAFPKSYAGKSPMLIAAYFCNIVGKSEKANELFILKDWYLENNFIVPRLLPGVLEMELFLAENCIPNGIASNATKKFLKNSIDKLGLNFSTVFGVQDYKNPKPDPEPYITLAKALGFKTEDFKDLWVFEDSITGTKAAKLAGMVPIGILTQHTEEELREVGSFLVFPTLKEAFYYLS